MKEPIIITKNELYAETGDYLFEKTFRLTGSGEGTCIAILRIEAEGETTIVRENNFRITGIPRRIVTLKK
jgi:hypothetical protein